MSNVIFFQLREEFLSSYHQLRTLVGRLKHHSSSMTGKELNSSDANSSSDGGISVDEPSSTNNRKTKKRRRHSSDSMMATSCSSSDDYSLPRTKLKGLLSGVVGDMQGLLDDLLAGNSLLRHSYMAIKTAKTIAL